LAGLGTHGGRTSNTVTVPMFFSFFFGGTSCLQSRCSTA
jgi:hypothetical protein